ncbi:hypothetical protein F949_00760 [Acinetobacter junii NIPH 182]|uniref:hypothetical protein n=1 Tax=Acinetobacter junii TaxID=40215 RepID=UPI0002CFD678|nr:hypothetical protein [Acinetobacter junii]ENV64668.1 hypothetical protein F949_00760 [Acinetobacter junii NIPH 182]
MDTLIKIDIDKFIENYPNQSSVAEFNISDLEKYMSELLKVAKEYGSINKFPNGVDGYLIFLMLANMTRISAQESDYADFTHEDLNIYKSAYQALYWGVKERFERAF